MDVEVVKDSLIEVQFVTADMRRFVAGRQDCHRENGHAARWHSCTHPDCREARRVENWLKDMGQA